MCIEKWDLGGCQITMIELFNDWKPLIILTKNYFLSDVIRSLSKFTKGM